MIKSFIEMNQDEAVWFMKGFQKLSTCEKNIVTFLLSQPDHSFYGTNVSLAEQLENPYSYNSEMSRALSRVSSKRIIKIHEPVKWYNRVIELSENWIEQMIAFGKEEEK